MIKKIIDFVKTDIWRVSLKKISPRKSFLIKQLRIVLLAFRGFDEDKCQLRASALTFYTLLSIVPVVAMAFGIAKGFGFKKVLEQQLLIKFPGQEETMQQVITFANSFLENVRGGLIAGIGVLLLFWTVVKVLGNIERSFNDIWGIKQARSIGRKLSDYLSIMVVCPIFIILSSSITVFIATQLKLITEKIALFGFLSPAIFFIIKLLPYLMIWVIFTFIYIFMPNTKVRLSSGVLGGIIAGTIYQLVQWTYITFQVGAAKLNAIYGSFAALPLFLIWIQISWLVVLFGAEISFAHQNVDMYEFEPDSNRVSHSFKKLLSLRITHLLVRHFSAGEKPLTPTEIAHILEIPIRLVRQILFELMESGIVTEIKTEEYKQVVYQPARDIGILTIKYVIDALEHRGADVIPVAPTRELESISDSLKEFSKAIETSSANKLLKEI
ncbi:MAG: YihY/virulence factor BrkB family protein [Candidatus Omnitrophota bacterium]